MTEPLSPDREQQIREAVPSAVCPAAHPDESDKGHAWVTGSLSGRDRCSACGFRRSELETGARLLLAELDRVRAELAVARGKALYEAADFIDNDDDCGCGGCDTCQPRKLAFGLRHLAAAVVPAAGEPT